MTSYLYCVRAGLHHASIAKIGVTKSFRHRLHNIVAVSPFACTLVSLIAFEDRDAANAWERHILLNANTFRPEGEWVLYDRKLIQLLSQVKGGRDVTEEFTYRGRRISIERREQSKSQVSVKNRRGLVGEDAARIVSKRLLDGFGVEDIAVMDGVDISFARAEMRRLRSLSASQTSGGAA